MSSCNITKFLSEDELVVDEVDLFIKGDIKGAESIDLKDELEKFYQIKPNKNRKSYNYYKYKDVENPRWIKRWLKKKRSQKPSLVDSTLIDETGVAIRNYLRNKKGYYEAELEYKVENTKPSKRAAIKYQIQTGPRYTINSIHHISEDSTLEKRLQLIALRSLIKPGDPIDALTFDLEKQRIVTEFQKVGYADFNLTNIEIKGDSTELKNSWDIFMMVMPPAESATHKRFSIGDIKVFTDYHQNQKENELSTDFRFNKNYLRQSSDFIVRPSTIDRKIYLNKYDRYNSDLYYKTIRSLFSLGTYRFAKLSPQINPQDTSLIDYNIFLTPHNQKYILDFGVEAFFSNIAIQNRNLIGVALNVGIEDRNAFNGSEILKTSIETGVEFDPTVPEVVTLSIGWNTKLEIPTLTKPLNVLRPLSKLHLIKDATMDVLQDEGKSNISLGFNYLDNLDQFKITAIKAGYGYDFVLNKRSRFIFNQIGINYTIYDIPANSPFQQILANNPLLRRSFQDNLFTGFLFKDLTYFYQTERGKNRANIAVISQLELSGVEVLLAQNIANSISGKNSKWTVGGLDFESLAKLEIDLRWYQKARARSQLAMRIRAGLAIPLDSDRTVTFIKQYSVGGPSSVRAWRPNHLGAGSYIQDGEGFFNPPANANFYQRGDILLDMSMEFRQDLAWVLEGAIFIDAGNVWTLREDIQRPGAKIGSDFLSTLAIGYGYGLRFDFNYFIIRFDLGFKLKYPGILDENGNATSQKSVWTGPNWGKPNSQKFGNFNIAINYPF